MYGLIGFPLSHSFSPQYFQEKFLREKIDECYELFPLENIQELHLLLSKNINIKGLNVTIPFKESVIPFLDYIDDDSKAIGAVNCINIKGKQLLGYNTDWMAFRQSLIPTLNLNVHYKALILGTGGAAKAVAYALQKMGIDHTFISRNKNSSVLHYSQITHETISSNQIIINTTPLGMYPNIDISPDIPYQYLGSQHICYDLVYNPANTLFLQKTNAQGAKIKNGLEMLQLQAEYSWDIWQHQQ